MKRHRKFEKKDENICHTTTKKTKTKTANTNIRQDTHQGKEENETYLIMIGSSPKKQVSPGKQNQ